MQIPVRLVNAGTFVQSETYRSSWTPLRTVEYCELELHHTAGATGCVDGVSVPYAEDIVLFARPGQQRQSCGVFTTDYIRFECTDDAFRAAYLDPLPVQIPPTDTDRRSAHFRAAADAYLTGGSVRELEACGHILTLIAELNQTQSVRPCARTADMARARRYIRTHYAEPLTLAQMAAQIPLSATHFWAQFKAAYGCTPTELLQRTRIAEAKRRLQMTDEPVTAVALACGFDSPAYFAQVFRARVGCTPTRYRDRHRARMG